MAKAIRFSNPGGPEVLEYVDVEIGEPGSGEAVVEHAACGLNFLDVYFRSGLYPLPLPGVVGTEGAGVVRAVGPGVVHVRPGDRVAYGGGPPGAYAQMRVMPASVLVRLPDAIDFDTAAAAMLKGLTVQYLLRRTLPLSAGDTVLLHAAAGGIGLIACQWARELGITVIGTVSSEEKAELARAHGCTHTIHYRTENIAERVRALTGGKGVKAVYDGVGASTFTASLDSLAKFGMLISFGNASGPVPPFLLKELTSRGSLYITRPSLNDHIAQREDLEAMAAELFGLLERGRIKIDIRQRYALSDAAQAHRDLEGGRTTGSSILIP